jgi:hypothetical protein
MGELVRFRVACKVKYSSVLLAIRVLQTPVLRPALSEVEGYSEEPDSPAIDSD